MPRLITDPNTIKCPDYDNQHYLPMRLQLVDDNITHEQAAIILRSIWDTQNMIEKQQWQAQLDNDEREDVERQGELEAELRRKEEESAKAKEEALREEMKKNKTKYTLIPKREVPSRPSIIPAISAVWKMDKGEYVPIWYYTKAGLENAKSFAAIDNDVLTLVTNSNGTMMLKPQCIGCSSEEKDTTDVGVFCSRY